MITPDVPGRGAWTLKGGLLPAKPGGTGAGYYRLAVDKEKPVGSAWVTGSDTSDSAHSVNLAVRALQVAFGMATPDLDGWLGPKTSAAGIAAQKKLGVEADGIFGPATMKALFAAHINRRADMYAVPRKILNGIVGYESAFDPGAVGVSGWDHGFCQINLGAHKDVSIEAAMNPEFALDFTAKDLRTVYNRTYVVKPGITSEFAWRVAILNHNSPKNAIYLRDTGEYPTAQSREYVEKVLSYQ